MSSSFSSIRRCVLPAAMAAGLAIMSMPPAVASASSVGADGGVITGTLSYTQPPPPATAPGCGPVAWKLNASGAAVAAQASAGTGGVDSFAFAGTTVVSGTGSSTCGQVAADLIGSLSLSITSTGSSGLLACSGTGMYVRGGAVFFAELAMDCSLNSRNLGSNLVTLEAALAPSAADLTQYQLVGQYAFNLSSVA
jgi:hypothetical protein